MHKILGGVTLDTMDSLALGGAKGFEYKLKLPGDDGFVNKVWLASEGVSRVHLDCDHVEIKFKPLNGNGFVQLSWHSRDMQQRICRILNRVLEDDGLSVYVGDVKVGAR